MRIGIVNDLAIAVEALKRVILSVPGYKIAWIASNGADSVNKAIQDKPDLILMDLIMPEMDGVQATQKIMELSPCPILIVTSTVTGNAAKVFDAMGYGALDAVCTPTFSTSGSLEGTRDILKKIDRLHKLIFNEHNHVAETTVVHRSTIEYGKILAIGASTGGPKAIANVLSKLPVDFSIPTVIVQHVDSHFAPGLVDWLNDQTPLEVRIAIQGARPEPNKVYLAATNDHLEIKADFSFHYTAEPMDYPYRPSVNVLFMSLAKYWKPKGIAVLLTGMGNDGAKGMLELKNNGWHTISQDMASSVVYGMPKAAKEMNSSNIILPINRIAHEIIKSLENNGTTQCQT